MKAIKIPDKLIINKSTSMNISINKDSMETIKGTLKHIKGKWVWVH